MPVWDEATDVFPEVKTSVVEVIDEDVVSTLNFLPLLKSPRPERLTCYAIQLSVGMNYYRWYAYSQS